MNSLVTEERKAIVDAHTYDRSVTVRSKLAQSGIQHYLDQPGITEVRINQPGVIITESALGWKAHQHPECTLCLLEHLANALSIYHGGTPLDLRNPIKSVRLPDGQRGQIVIPPGCEPGTVALTFRVASPVRFAIDDYLQSGRLSQYRDVSMFKEVPSDVRLQDYEFEILAAKHAQDMKRFFQLAIDHKLNICIVGGVGSGKTTFMKALADMMPTDICIITIEDTHELSLPLHWNKVHLFYGDFVTPTDAIKSCTRMKPDRIFVTELRGNEAWDYLAALNTGHPGSLTTVHANSPIEAFQRIATLVKQSEVGKTMDWQYLIREVTASIDVIVYFNRTFMTQLYYDPVRRAKILRGDKDV